VAVLAVKALHLTQTQQQEQQILVVAVVDLPHSIAVVQVQQVVRVS
jgi:hypothetical protein